MCAVVWSFEHCLALPFFVSGMKTDIFSPVATAEGSKFAGTLNATLLQHHILGFETAQLNWNSITSTSFVCSDAS